ncbi:delta 1-pyrroline-5-carboxylate synthetase [uncultured Methanobrevibacter sp.]|uniref:amino acid kinase family protein n=1 Tax=uncultured Methanobrevibacter sp. TaxID=253161 RepID=UPI002634BCBD|nr:delta 1-pyrroline-5-carboxylate synthetase [uncultured Methanobrevibacter sp.]
MELANSLKGTNCLIITGGGEFANLIRKYDGEIGFSNDVTHETAIQSMDITAKLLNDKLDFTKITSSLENLENILDSGKIPILICSDILKDNSNIYPSWNVTSDSISAYVSNILKAKLLIATNVDGIYSREPNSVGSKFFDEIDAKKLLTFNETSVDLMLSELLIKFGNNCFVVNGSFPERVLSLIGGKNSDKMIDDDYKPNYNFRYTLIRGE